MARQVAVEPGVGRQELRIVGEPGVAGQLVSDFGVLVEVTVVEPCDRPRGGAGCYCDRTSALRPFIVSFTIHELARGGFQRAASPGMAVEKILQPRMISQELRIVRQRRLGR